MAVSIPHSMPPSSACRRTCGKPSVRTPERHRCSSARLFQSSTVKRILSAKKGSRAASIPVLRMEPNCIAWGLEPKAARTLCRCGEATPVNSFSKSNPCRLDGFPRLEHRCLARVHGFNDDIGISRSEAGSALVITHLPRMDSRPRTHLCP